MLQIDHVYEFFYKTLFNNFEFRWLSQGVPVTEQAVSINNFNIFTQNLATTKKIFFYDQEPVTDLTAKYLDVFSFPDPVQHPVEYIWAVTNNSNRTFPYQIPKLPKTETEFYTTNTEFAYKKKAWVVSEHSAQVNQLSAQFNLHCLYYFFHGFAALDWYRGFRALNYTKKLTNTAITHDFVSMNRIITGDRSYRIFWIALLAERKLLNAGQISFAVDGTDWQTEIQDSTSKLSATAKQQVSRQLASVTVPLIIDQTTVPGWASADIPRRIDSSLWHIVSETVYYYNKLHLTEKVFKPIVMKQPFMLLAAPGNLEYLRSYGFRTFSGIIDESYDNIQDSEARARAVADQLSWYCSLSAQAKAEIVKELEPIVEHNFHWFYTEFPKLITDELLTNCRQLFKEIGYDDDIDYNTIGQLLIN